MRCFSSTPTGAAFLRSQASFSESLPESFRADGVSYGAGTWDLAIPNVLRLYLGELSEKEAERGSDFLVLETNIDDMSPQIYGYLYERLFAAGALDVWTTPIVMKKTRPAQMLSLLCRTRSKDACASVILRETTSIGLRVRKVTQRIEAERETVHVATPYGEVACKRAFWHGALVNSKPEYEDCCLLARRAGVPLKQVEEAARQAALDAAHRTGRQAARQALLDAYDGAMAARQITVYAAPSDSASTTPTGWARKPCKLLVWFVSMGADCACGLRIWPVGALRSNIDQNGR